MSNYVEIFFTDATQSEGAQAFTDAQAFWNQVINSSPTSPLNFPNGFNSNRDCGVSFNFPSNTRIEGLGIISAVEPIDGPGQILGSAGPCIFDGQVPKLGIMRFDIADVSGLIDSGNFGEVIKHEMAHVIGIGTVWQRSGFLNNPCNPFFSFFGCDPTYNQPNGIEGFNDLGGSGPLPVANTGGAGTQNGHWREETFENELMTGFLNGGIVNPLSIMTIKSLKDIGYDVNEDQAEVYSIPTTTVLTQQVGYHLEGDLATIPPVDIRDVMARLAAEEAAAESDSFISTETTLFSVGVALVAMFSLITVFVVHRARKANSTAVEETVVDEEAAEPVPVEAKPAEGADVAHYTKTPL